MTDFSFKKIRRYKNLKKEVLFLSAFDYNDVGNKKNVTFQELLDIGLNEKISVSSGGSHRDCTIYHGIECIYIDSNIKMFKTTSIYVGSYPTFPKYERNNYYFIELSEL